MGKATKDTGKAAEEAKEEVKKETPSANLDVGKTLYASCISCHGSKAEKKALGKSQIIATWSKDKIVQALEGYKNKSYGGAMKNLMYPQASKLSKEQMEQIAEYISNF
ncbi:MAG: cytochrome C [Proteobacteria bacterium]|nr:MAG: cytochrome C [Pseudomonadota bacterium]